jgi:cellulose synthase (UDP-forming)
VHSHTVKRDVPAMPPSGNGEGRASGWLGRQALTRVFIVLTVGFGVTYVGWRWLYSVNWSVWWIAVPLVVAETYSLTDSFLFGVTMWRMRKRDAPPPPSPGATVDVLITTYNEPVDMVMTTTAGALAITHPHKTWILDDGARPDMAAAAEAAGVGYLVRSEEWSGRSRHAKAGNLNNALMAIEGEFLLILDADQVPSPEILDHTLGYFRDEQVALVQTPQWFSNVTDSDPLGSQAPLFYGPIQQGKDGWNAAFFCGSNAVLRREALMQLGVVGYVEEVERSVRDGLRTADSVLAKAGRSVRAQGDPLRAALADVRTAARAANEDVSGGERLSEVTYRFQRRVDEATRGLVEADLSAMQADLVAIAGLGTETDARQQVAQVNASALDLLSRREWSPLAALESVQAVVRAVDVDRADEAQAIMPMATISVTEDMATAMRLHGLGWRSVYHNEILAEGLAPEDLGTMLQQRLRWAQGTLQVLLRENPLMQRGLSWGQRLMYFSTMWTYLSGFAAVVYIAAPVLFLCFGLRPVLAYGPQFVMFIPYLVANQILFFIVGYGIRTWRGHQYSLALFPLWIRAFSTAVGNVVFGRTLGFVVTSKTRGDRVSQWRFIKPQLAAIGLLVVAVVVGVIRMVLGDAPSVTGTLVNVVWVSYDLVVLSVIIEAAMYKGMTARGENS